MLGYGRIDLRYKDTWDLIDEYAVLRSKSDNQKWYHPNSDINNDVNYLESEIKSRICKCGKSIMSPQEAEVMKRIEEVKLLLESTMDKLSQINFKEE